MNIGENLKHLREKRDLTLEQVGNYIGVTKATVQRYETGEIDIKRTVAMKLAELFGVTPSQILGWGEQKFITTPLEQQIIEKYRRMPEMQSAVNRILGIEVEKTVKIKMAARTKSDYKQQDIHEKEIEKDKLDKLEILPNEEALP